MSDFARVVLKADTFEAVVLPQLGAKVASLRVRSSGVELLQPPLASYALRTRTMGFEESDASGFDDCLPSVAACAVTSNSVPVSVPDHGDMWRQPYDYEQRSNAVQMAALSFSLPLRIEKTVRAEGELLRIEYRATNLARHPVGYAWSAHPLFTVDAGDRVLLPPGVRTVSVEGSAHNRLGPKGTVHPWPLTKDSQGNAVDLSVAGRLDDGIGDKVYAVGPVEGWCAIERPKAGVRVEIGFDPVRTPCLGLWLCYGGWPAGHENRQYCIAPEPCTAPVDSLAEAMDAGQEKVLQPGQTEEWWMTVRVAVVS